MPIAEPLLCKLCRCLVIVGRGHDLCHRHQVWSGFSLTGQRAADEAEEATINRWFWQYGLNGGMV